MDKDEENKKGGKIKQLVLQGALLIGGLIIVPWILKYFVNKGYKKSLNTAEIDFDNLGPEIIPFSKEKKEDEL